VSDSMTRRRTAALATAGALFGLTGLTTAGGLAAAPAQGAVRSIGAAESSSECTGTAPPIAPPTGQWSCTLDDEFNGTALDTNNFQAMLSSTSSYHTGPLGAPACYENDPNTISESGGYLNLSVVSAGKTFQCKELDHSFNTKYVGGMASSMGLFSQQYGFFEARAEMPAQATPGLQETLWLYPSNETLYGQWPNSGEIDYGEFYSKYPDNDIPVVHFPGSGSDPDATNDYCTQPGTATAGQFNTYAVMWTPTTITTYFNGVPCMSDTYAPYVKYPDKAPAPYTQPFFLNFTAALGTGNGGNTFKPSTTPLPATTKIDWVRVWQY
jgi:beta-glucanase (GH16 family)